MSDRVRFQLMLSRGLVRNIKADAARVGMSPSELVREAYREWALRRDREGEWDGTWPAYCVDPVEGGCGACSRRLGSGRDCRGNPIGGGQA